MYTVNLKFNRTLLNVIRYERTIKNERMYFIFYTLVGMYVYNEKDVLAIN